jgi:hypothetical protein
VPSTSRNIGKIAQPAATRAKQTQNAEHTRRSEFAETFDGMEIIADQSRETPLL